MEQQLQKIKENVDRYADLTAQVDAAKDEQDKLKGFFEGLAQEDLEDTKNKTVEYFGSNGNKISVQNVDTVKPIAFTVLKKLLGSSFSDFVKEEVKYTLTDACKEFLSNMFQGAYIEDELHSVISKITDDSKKQKLLAKKLKGKYPADKKVLIKNTDLSESEASDYAYMINEVMAYQRILQIMKASEFNGTLEDAVTNVKSAIIVDEKVKVTFECKE